MDVISGTNREFLKLESLEQCEKRVNLLHFQLNKIMKVGCLENCGKAESMNDEQVIRTFELLTSRCDVSNFSDDLKWKRDMEEEVERRKELLKTLGDEQEETKKELATSKNQIFNLLQKLSCARSEIIEREEAHRKVVGKMVNSYKSEKISMEAQFNKIKTDLGAKEGELEVINLEFKLLKSSLEERKINSHQVLSQLDDKSNDNVNNGTFNGNNEECKGCEETKHEKETLRGQIEQLTRELGRLRKHLESIEDTHNNELLESNQEIAGMKEQLKQYQQLLTSALQTEANVREEMDATMERWNTEMKDKENEIKELKDKIISCESTIAEYSSSIINLHAVLEQYEKNHHILETAEVDKCRRDLASVREAKFKISRELLEKEKENNDLNSELSSIKRQGEELKSMRRDYEWMKNEMAQKDQEVGEMERQVKKLKVDDAAKVEKLLMRNLLVGYFQAPATRREDVAYVIGRFLDFNADDYDAITAGRGKGGSGRDMFKHQSFSELFVKFLESESAPSSPTSEQPQLLEQQIIQLQQNQQAKNNTQTQHLAIKEKITHQQQSFNTKVPALTTSSTIPIHHYLQSLQKQQQQHLQQQQNPYQQLQQHFSKHYLQHSFNFLPTPSNSLQQTFKGIPTTQATIPPTTITTTITSSSPTSTQVTSSIDTNSAEI